MGPGDSGSRRERKGRSQDRTVRRPLDFPRGKYPGEGRGHSNLQPIQVLLYRVSYTGSKIQGLLHKVSYIGPRIQDLVYRASAPSPPFMECLGSKAPPQHTSQQPLSPSLDP